MEREFVVTIASGIGGFKSVLRIRSEDANVSEMVEAHIRNYGVDSFVDALGLIIPEMRLIAVRAKVNNNPNTDKHSRYSVMEKTYLAISELPEQ
jgi:hypothetical protein